MCPGQVSDSFSRENVREGPRISGDAPFVELRGKARVRARLPLGACARARGDMSRQRCTGGGFLIPEDGRRRRVGGPGAPHPRPSRPLHPREAVWTWCLPTLMAKLPPRCWAFRQHGLPRGARTQAHGSAVFGGVGRHVAARRSPPRLYGRLAPSALTVA